MINTMNATKKGYSIFFHTWRDKRELDRLKRLPRYTPTSSMFRGKRIIIVDTRTYLVGLNEIFSEGIYEFKTERDAPLIIDCGANIGLSVLYFKILYPSARLIAFEPDSKIFEALRLNIESFGLNQVELHQAAVWLENGTVSFKPEGGYSGRISSAAENTVQVPSIRLRDFLRERVDFLKIDIEGSELQVLEDCSDLLDNVERIFVEYHSESGKPQLLDELLTIIRKGGFRYQIKEAYVAKKPFICQPSMMNMDLQLNIFCFRNNIT
jgi:FkbM family methyltransferase